MMAFFLNSFERPILIYHKLDPSIQISMKFNQNATIILQQIYL